MIFEDSLRRTCGPSQDIKKVMRNTLLKEEKHMKIEQKSVEEFYNSINEEERLKRQNVNKIEFLTTIYYLDKNIKSKSKILDACAGAGIYSYYFAEKGHRVHCGDLVEKNVDDIKKNSSYMNILEDVFVGSILDLSRYENESFDVVLNLGSYYHLTNDEIRKESLKESLRVLKKGGIYALSYINKMANIIKYREMFVGNFNLLDEYMDKGFHSENEIFFASHPLEVESELESLNVEIESNLATDGMKFIIRDTINNLNEDDFNQWMNYHLSVCEDKSILGVSEHGLIIGKKK